MTGRDRYRGESTVGRRTPRSGSPNSITEGGGEGAVISQATMPTTAEIADLIEAADDNEAIWIITEDQTSNSQNRAEVMFQAVRSNTLDRLEREILTTPTASNTIQLPADTVVHINSTTDFRILSTPILADPEGSIGPLQATSPLT